MKLVRNLRFLIFHYVKISIELIWNYLQTLPSLVEWWHPWSIATSKYATFSTLRLWLNLVFEIFLCYYYNWFWFTENRFLHFEYMSNYGNLLMENWHFSKFSITFKVANFSPWLLCKDFVLGLTSFGTLFLGTLCKDSSTINLMS